MIGIFDSGSGGLSVLTAVRKLLPNADVVYFGDIKNVPYGKKTQEELSILTLRAIDRVRTEGATHIISACNSVAASLVMSLSDRLRPVSGDIIEMVGPTVAHWEGSDARLALCATSATITSGIYQSAFQLIGKEVQYYAIPELAGAIEAGASEDALQKIIADAFPEKYDFNTLILSCTHYPFVQHLFQEVLPNVTLFDPAMVVAERAVSNFGGEASGSGTTRFLISQDSLFFRNLVDSLYNGTPYTIEVVSTDV